MSGTTEEKDEETDSAADLMGKLSVESKSDDAAVPEKADVTKDSS